MVAFIKTTNIHIENICGVDVCTSAIKMIKNAMHNISDSVDKATFIVRITVFLCMKSNRARMMLSGLHHKRFILLSTKGWCEQNQR